MNLGIPKYKELPTSRNNLLGLVPFTDLLLTFIIFLFVLRVLIPFIHSFIVANTDQINPSILLTGLVLIQSLMMLVLVHFFILKKHGLDWHSIGLKTTPILWCYRAILLALPLVIIVSLANYLVVQLVDNEFSNPQLQDIAPERFTWLSFIFVMIATGIIAPFTEELIFRGVLLGWLHHKYGSFIAILVSSIFFGSMHGVPMLIPALTIAGIAFALITYQSKSLWPAIILHAIFNMVMTSSLFYDLSQGVKLPGTS